MTGYIRKFDGNTTMFFKINDKQLLKKYNQIRKRIEKLLEIKFDSKPVYGGDEKYIKTKIKKYVDSVITNFHGKKNAKRKISMQVFINNNARFCYRSKKKYYLQTLLEECKYEQKRIKMENLMDDNWEKSESDESDSETESDNDNDESDK